MKTNTEAYISSGFRLTDCLMQKTKLWIVHLIEDMQAILMCLLSNYVLGIERLPKQESIKDYGKSYTTHLFPGKKKFTSSTFYSSMFSHPQAFDPSSGENKSKDGKISKD